MVNPDLIPSLTNTLKTNVILCQKMQPILRSPATQVSANIPIHFPVNSPGPSKRRY